MCLLDTTDGALMFSLYIQPAANFLPRKQHSTGTTSSTEEILNRNDIDDSNNGAIPPPENNHNHRDPIAFLYYSIVLTTLTVIVAIIIGVIQLLTMIMNAAQPKGKFWDGVQTAGDYYDVIGGSICGCFLIFGLLSVIVYKPWRRWVAKRHGRGAVMDQEQGYRDEFVGMEDGTGFLDLGGSGSAGGDGGSTDVTGKEAGVSQVAVKQAQGSVSVSGYEGFH